MWPNSMGRQRVRIFSVETTISAIRLSGHQSFASIKPEQGHDKTTTKPRQALH